MITGEFINDFLVEEIVYSHQGGVTHSRVRYEGSYVSRYLCAVEVETNAVAGAAEERAQKIRNACSVYAGCSREQKGGSVVMLLPENVTTCCEGKKNLLLGFFQEHAIAAYLKAGHALLSLVQLGPLSQFLTRLHAKRVGVGALLPVCVRADGTMLFLPCPVFPVVRIEGAVWACGLDEAVISFDRKCFAQLVASAVKEPPKTDAAPRASAPKQDKDREAIIATFLTDPACTCEWLVTEMAAANARYGEAAVRRVVVRKRFIRSAACLSAAAVLSGLLAFTYVNMLNAARNAKASGQWQVCADTASRVLTYFPWHEEAKQLKADAVRELQLAAALEKARKAQSEGQWSTCLETVKGALAMAPSNAELLQLQKEASNEIQWFAAWTSAQEAHARKRWQECVEQATVVLVMKPQHEGALALKADAEQTLRTFSAALAAAQEAKALKNWATCLEKVSVILGVDSNHVDARAIKAEADCALKVIAALASAREAKASENWERCVELTRTALQAKPGNAEAEGLKEEAERAVKTLNDALAAAREAKATSQWQICLDRAGEALTVKADHEEAKGLRAAAARELKLANALIAARQAKEAVRWQECLDKASEALAVNKEHFEAQALRDEAERAIKLAQALAALKGVQASGSGDQWRLIMERATEVLKYDPGNEEVQTQLTTAQYELGMCYSLGKGTARDLVEAAKCFQAAAERNHALAQCELAKCYAVGTGVAVNAVESVRLYRLAAENNIASAQNYLGVCYDEGVGLQRNVYEAVKWYRKAADQGHAFAQYNLGVCYAIGKGVRQDYVESVKLYYLAALQNNPDAQYALGVCYAEGKGVNVDREMANDWLAKARSAGNQKAGEKMRNVSEGKVRVLQNDFK